MPAAWEAGRAHCCARICACLAGFSVISHDLAGLIAL
jgi:hypothetical protein